jgi:hypothetical protein
VQKAWTELKANRGSPYTPAGAAARPADLTVPNGIYVPPWRQGGGSSSSVGKQS